MSSERGVPMYENSNERLCFFQCQKFKSFGSKLVGGCLISALLMFYKEKVENKREKKDEITEVKVFSASPWRYHQWNNVSKVSKLSFILKGNWRKVTCAVFSEILLDQSFQICQGGKNVFYRVNETKSQVNSSHFPVLDNVQNLKQFRNCVHASEVATTDKQSKRTIWRPRPP